MISIIVLFTIVLLLMFSVVKFFTILNLLLHVVGRQ